MVSWKMLTPLSLLIRFIQAHNQVLSTGFDVHTQTIPTKFFHYSTHAFGIAEAIELARALKQLPQDLIVYGIEGKCFEAGIGLSREVEKAVEEVMMRVKTRYP